MIFVVRQCGRVADCCFCLLTHDIIEMQPCDYGSVKVMANILFAFFQPHLSSSCFSCVAFLAAVPVGGCPFLEMQKNFEDPAYMEELVNSHYQQRRLNPNERNGDGGVPAGGYAAVRAEISKVLSEPQAFWPADEVPPPSDANYGGFIIRLAWHCAGSYRNSDGRGGCDGGRIRFPPESTWPDNGNLDMALKLLEPVKDKFGESLSWGDLIILAGNTVIEEMGGKILGFCGGRIDDPDGSQSVILGPSEIQEALAPCQSIGEQGQCAAPLGPTTVGLIYVNPAGPVGNQGDPLASGEDIRSTFARMGFDDREVVSLVGGGHAFGKAHGACTEPPCGSGDLMGKGPNTFTSGFEGAWTTTPTVWTNQFFTNLFAFNWELGTGAGGRPQWFPVDGPDITMLTTDMALAEDPDYKVISQEYAADIGKLEDDFALSWYRLTTADMGPFARCLGDEVPPAQPWQYELPTAPTSKPDYVPVRWAIQDLIDKDSENIAAFAKLAWNCAATFRETDYRGGCNGARIRFSPEKDWASNAGSAAALATLESVKSEFDDVSYADLIVLAGQTAVEAAGGEKMDFCGGRVDAADGAGSHGLEPRVYPNPFISIQDNFEVKGLTDEEGVAITAAIKYIGKTLSNQFFVNLQAESGVSVQRISEEEMALLQGDLGIIVEKFASDEDAFLAALADGWTKMMTADRFDGPSENLCGGVNDHTIGEQPNVESENESAAACVSVLAAGVAASFAALFV
jgi:catalase-peroxidase